MKYLSLISKNKIICWLFMMIAGTAIAQPKIITIDTTTGVPSEALPFHRPFFLKKLSARSDKPIAISLFDHIRNKSLSETIARRTHEYEVVEDSASNPKTIEKEKIYTPKHIQKEYYFMRLEGGKNYLYINFRDTLALQPSTQYSVVIYYQAHPDAPKVFTSLHQVDSISVLTDSATVRKKAQFIRKAVDQYNEIAEKNKKEGIYFGYGTLSYPDSTALAGAAVADFDKVNGIIRDDYPWVDSAGSKIPYRAGFSTIGRLFTYHHKNVEPLIKINNILQNTLDSIVQVGVRTGLQTVAVPLFDTLGQLYLHYDTLSSSKIRDMFTQDNNRTFQSISQLKQLSGQLYQEIANGLHPLFCEFCKSVKADDLASRVKNLEETMGDINKVRLLTQLLANQKPTLIDLDKRLQQLLTDLTAVRNVLKMQISNQDKLGKAITDNKLFTSTDFAGGDTYVFNFETRTKYSVVPEFGISTNYPFGKSSNYLLMPYIGATINFAQLDRDVPFYLIRKKSFWQRTGLVLGYTLVSLKDSTANPPRDNFFDKSAFITGLSLWRFSNTVKAIAGLTWLYKRAPDTGMRTLTALPFIGLSFDLDIKKYLSDLVGAVTSLKGAPDKKTSTDSRTP